MFSQTLTDYLESLAGAGHLSRVAVEVDPDLEIAEITARTAKAGGPALLFERVAGTSTAVVTNLFGSVERICLALGVDSLDQFLERVEQLANGEANQNWLDRLKMRGSGSSLDRFTPKRVKSGTSQQVVMLGRDVNLSQFPALRSWPEESNRAITGAMLLTSETESSRLNLSREILPVLAENQLGIHLHPLSSSWESFERARANESRLPIAVVLGGPPLLTLLAGLPFSDQVDLLALTGLLSERALEMVTCRTQELEIPTSAEMVLEGYLDPQDDPSVSVRLACNTGSYFQGECQPIHITAVTHRNNPAVAARILGCPPTEQTAINRLSEKMLLAMLRLHVPELLDLALPEFSGQHQFLVVSINKPYAGSARKVASALWGSGSLMMTKTIVMVDRDIDLRDLPEVMFQVGVNVVPGRDVFFHDGPVDPLAPQLTGTNEARKMAIDATSKASLPSSATLARSRGDTQALVERRWSEYGLGET